MATEKLYTACVNTFINGAFNVRIVQQTGVKHLLCVGIYIELLLYSEFPLSFSLY